MKRTIIFIVTLCLIAALVPISVGAEGEKLSYVALGDSITAGYGLGSLNDAFPSLLAAELGNEYTLSNKAVSGDTTSDLLSHLKKSDYKQAVAAADVITVTIGGNDLLAFLYSFLAEKLGMTLSQVTAAFESGDHSIVTKAAQAIIEGNFAPSAADQAAISTSHAEIVKQIKALNPNVKLIIALQYNPYENLAKQVSSIPSFVFQLQPELKTLADAIVKLSEAVEATVIPFNEGVKSRAAEQSYIVADAYTAFKNSSENLANAAFIMSPLSIELDFHPNKAGHAALAACIKAALSQSLSCDHASSTVKPSCESSVTCSVCGGVMEPMAHTSKVLPAIPATCTENGLTEGSECSVCKAIITAQEVVTATGHSGGSATCKSPAKCEVCGVEYGELDPDHSKFMVEGLPSFNESDHWNECMCGQRFFVTAHTPDNSGACTGCQYKKAVNTGDDTSETELTDAVTPPAGEIDIPKTDTKSCVSTSGAFAVIIALTATLGIALIKKHRS